MNELDTWVITGCESQEDFDNQYNNYYSEGEYMEYIIGTTLTTNCQQLDTVYF